jgi:hypothetical protein
MIFPSGEAAKAGVDSDWERKNSKRGKCSKISHAKRPNSQCTLENDVFILISLANWVVIYDGLTIVSREV